MIVLDAYPVIALISGEAVAPEVGELLRVEPEHVLTAVGLAEVLDFLVRVGEVDRNELLLDLAVLGLLDAWPVSPQLAMVASDLRSRHYRKKTSEVSMADCIAAAVAQELESPLATSDPALLGMCHTESIAVIPLPESSGRRWSPPPVR